MDRKPAEEFFRTLLFPVLPVGLFLLLGAIVFWASWRRENVTANGRSAATALKTLSTAEADFRANDRDQNGVQDFWTGDVAGLYRLGLIERGVAEADLKPLVPLVPRPIPFNGYYFVAMSRDDSETPPESLQQDTDKKSGKVHHLRKFGFAAIPAKFNVTGVGSYIVNEYNTVRWKYTYTEMIDAWPSDEDMRHEWAIGG